MSCYVLGCDEETTVGRRHKFYGCVDCCLGHDPERHAMALPLTGTVTGRLTTHPPELQTLAPPADSWAAGFTYDEIITLKALVKTLGPPPDDGGQRVKVPPRVPRFPPPGATANGGRRIP